MKKILLSFSFLLMVSRLVAQQDPLYSQYMFNMLAVNPAYAGSREVISVTALARWQWAGIDGAPRTQTLSADMPIRHKSIGLGLQLTNDALGDSRNTGIYGSYAFRIRLDNRSLIALGVQGGASFYNLSLSDRNYSGLGNQPADPAASNFSGVLPNAGFGVYFNNDRFYLGVSIPHLLKNQLNNYTTIDPRSNRAVQYRHLFLATGFVVPLSDQVALKPSALVKLVTGSPIQFDINANVWLKEVFAVGLSYRSNTAVLAMIEAQFTKQFRFGYAYDFTYNNLRSYQSGSHEIMLRYEFGQDKNKMLTPRYF
jgi:type IX secretion system PorP/SprF family membrane protein